MDDLRKRFGRLVAVHRRRAGITQEQLAEAASVSVDTISKLETGATGARFPVIERIAGALCVDPAELFTTEFRTGSPRSQAFTELSIKLAALNDADLAWITSVVEAALSQRK